ncbi:MAG: Rpn family recombination-promoting nuclease/putative transposase, partial [Isosphaeraceae bacterium]
MMPKPFDATMRRLFELEPAAWLRFLGFAVPDPEQITVIDSNLSTVTADADKVLHVGGAEPLIVHTEFLSGRDKDYPGQAVWYNVLLHRRHKVPVWTVLVLLRPGADGSELTGEYESEVPGRGQNLRFRYDVIRVWLEAPERLLTSGLPLLPLAPVSNVAPENLHDVLTTVASRLRDEADPGLNRTLWTATAILLGLRYSREQVEELIEGVAKMILGIRGIEDSWVYQDILARGRAEGEATGEARGRAEGQLEGARLTLLGFGRKRLGEPSEQVLSKIAAVRDLDQLNRLVDRLLDVTTW